MPNWKKLIVSGSDASLNNLIVNNAVTASYFKGDGSALTNVQTEITEVATVVDSFTSQTSVLTTHNFGTKNILVSVYDDNDQVLIPASITTTTDNTVTTTFDTSTTGRVVVAKGGHIVSGVGTASNSNTLNGQSGSYYLDYTNFTNVPADIVSSSAQIASDISGSFNFLSSSFITRFETGETSIASLNAASSSYLLNTTDTLVGDLTVTGKVTAQEFHTEIISSSIIYESGSTKFGDSADDKHSFTGSVRIDGSLDATGSVDINGAVTATSFSGTFIGALSSSAQIAADISGSFSDSVDTLSLSINGIDTRVLYLEGKTLLSSSAQIAPDISGSFEGPLNVLRAYTGSYATTGSNIFIGDQRITGSLLTSGSVVTFDAYPWPIVGQETHLLKTQPYEIIFNEVTRSYGYHGIALEHIEDGTSYYHNSLLLYTYNSGALDYGGEVNIGPVRTHLRQYASGSNNFANVSVQEIAGGTSQALIYAQDVQVGAYKSDSILIGNTGSAIVISGSSIDIASDITASGHLIPGANETYDLGTPSLRWRDLYVSGGTIYLGNTTISEDTAITTVNLQQNLPVGSISSSAQIAADISGSFTPVSASLASRISSNDSEILNLQSDSGSFSTRISNNESSLSSLNAASSSYALAANISGSFTSFSSSLSTRISSDEISINALNAATSSYALASNISGSFNLASGSFSSRVSTLESTSTAHGDRLDSLQAVTSSYALAANISGSLGTNATLIRSLTATKISGSLGSNATLIRSLTANTISGSLGSNATLIRSLTAAKISGSLGSNATLIRSLTAAKISGSFTSLSGSIATDINTKLNIADTGSFAKTTIDNSFAGQQTFNNIVVNGTGSFSYIQSITGSAKLIGDAFVVVNSNTPAERFAGLKVYDSGSANTTASLEFDGETNDWFYEYSDDGGATTDHGVVIFGAEYSTKGTPTYPTSNKVQKGLGGHHIGDSNITDTGTLITLGSNTTVSGTIKATGTTLISSSAQIASDISGSFTAVSASFANTIGNLTSDYTELTNIPANIVSSSAQLAPDISGSFTALSSSFASRISSNDSDILNLQSNSGSFSTRVSSLESFTGGLDSDISTLSLPANTTISTFGKSLVDDADAATARTTLGLGTAATSASTDFMAVTGDSASGTYTFSGQINLTQTANTIGGATVTNGSLVVGNGTTGIGIDNNEIHSTGVLYIGTNTGNLILRPAGNVVDASGNRFLTTADEGSGNGIDADTLDGQHASAFLTSYTETDTLATVTGRGATTSTASTFSGGLTANTLRLTSTTDASVSSTGHAFQIGGDGSTNIIMDSNEIMARNNGAVSSLNLNPDGGDITIHNNTTAGTFTIGGNQVIHAGNYTSYTDNKYLRSDTADTATQLTVDTLIIGTASKIQFANNDFIRYDDANGVGRFHFDADGGTSNASVQAATFVGAFSGDGSGVTSLNASNISSGTFPDLFSPSARYNIGLIDGNGDQTRDKIRVWSSGAYTIGMKNGYTFGNFSSTYAMSFQMNNDSARGFWWGDDGHTDAQGAMALTTDGKLNVAKSVSIGEGESVTSPSATPLYVYGSGSLVLDVQGSVGQLFSVDDTLTGEIFAAADISGVPILAVNSSGIVSVTGDLQVTGDITAYYSSDINLKKNIKPIENPLEKLKLISGNTFEWDENNPVHSNKGKDVGVIAQEIEKVLPEIVTERRGHKAVQYEKIVALLIESNKALLARVEELESKIK